MRPLTIQGSYVGTVEELMELVELVKETHMSAIPVKRLPISQINSAFEDLKDGKVIGRIVLMHEN
jgi:D-arabinose 1-dehydrogenase-like Zn-dependent alcohol dehydrogenase